ncbi:hypothetical protein [Shimia sediminis]|uniref:hypothetical protein n=1 Tax=Shimia sediminis TaxID=2497945 RepID=UPI000F8E2CDE|nr:hypothetical protein [Shimia sediminis]
MKFVSALFRTLIGLVFGAASAMALSPAFAAFHIEGSDTAPLIAVTLVILCGALCLFAPSSRRAFGRGFLLLGVSVFALPVSTFLLSGRAATDVIASSESGSEAATAIGAGMAGVAITGLATFFGLIVGAILLLIGLVLSLGGRREVIVVEK